MNNLYSFNNTDFDHITNSNHTLLQLLLYRKGLVKDPSKAAVKRRGPRTILDLKGMDSEKWLKYVQWTETEFKWLKLLNKIQEAREKKTDNNDIESSCLQEIWDKIEKTIKNTSKKFIPTKKLSEQAN